MVSFASEHNWDSLDFYDGGDNHAPRLGSYSGNLQILYKNLKNTSGAFIYLASQMCYDIC